MKHIIKIFVFLLVSGNTLHAVMPEELTQKDVQNIMKQLDDINRSMSDTISHLKQVNDRNKNDDVDLDFINNLFHQNNENIKIHLKNGFSL